MIEYAPFIEERIVFLILCRFPSAQQRFTPVSRTSIRQGERIGGREFGAGRLGARAKGYPLCDDLLS